jgi:hypothetical protein
LGPRCGDFRTGGQAVTRAPQPGQEIPVEQMSGGVLTRMRPDPGIGAVLPPRAATPGSGSPKAWYGTPRLGDNVGMARDDRWAQVLRVSILPLLDGIRPAGMLGWVSPVAPVVTQAAVGAGYWAAGRRQRALAAWASAAGYGLVAWGLGTEAPTPAEARQNMQQNIQWLQRQGLLPKPGPKAAPAADGTQTPTARHLSLDGPLYRLASAVVAMVLGVWWGLRWPRRLTVLVVASAAPNAVLSGLWAARAVQRRRPRIAAGYALITAGSVARLRAASAEPLR